MLGDISQEKNQVLIYQNGKKADDDVDVWSEALQSSIPIEFEDDWGNRLQPNWDVKLNGE